MRTGLRTEIAVSICLLLGAALMFAGFLLVKLTEQELLEQRLQHARATAALVVTLLQQTTVLAQDAVARDVDSYASISTVVAMLQKQSDLLGWRLLDSRQQVLASMMVADLPPFEISPVVTVYNEPSEVLNYSSRLLPWQAKKVSYVDLSIAADSDDSIGSLLQLRFSLQSLVERIHRAQRLILIYVVAYGLVLCLFGIYLLHRNLVQPIRRLQQATAEVAAGSLVPLAAADGPVEIVDLSNSYNQMIDALQKSRTETETHICSLESANLSLEQARDQLVRSEKMATVGHLAAGMAHEIGNPLAALVGYLGLLEADQRDCLQKDLIERCQTETGRIDKLIRELLDYAAPGSGEAVPVDPVAVLRETVTMLQHQGMFDGVVVDDRCGQVTAQVLLDSHRLQQVWVNLLLNARDAMDGTGTVHLATEINGDRFAVLINDEGPGITAAQVGKIFEPFYTTKDPGKGRGLGLAVCQRIIDAAGGRIEVRSGTSGTIFSVCLPLVGTAHSETRDV
ncbi:MAG: hypothetical protein C0614_01155 [Desulfuromonas sp.]|nr:MAG: hypothetical protein C0614_01155 [Desulfuromonas sp.]